MRASVQTREAAYRAIAWRHMLESLATLSAQAAVQGTCRPLARGAYQRGGLISEET
ncbi:hypothetical protein [Lacticaseibacillus absianus]|uniref:hypothetical protein n=1 Tax=Lacticaseibacillus absianus TaxID=2729623 RepID=UPI0015C8EF50|nr:hypothetical protein [Lacticaseibacillus absianus]